MLIKTSFFKITQTQTYFKSATKFLSFSPPPPADKKFFFGGPTIRAFFPPITLVLESPELKRYNDSKSGGFCLICEFENEEYLAHNII